MIGLDEGLENVVDQGGIDASTAVDHANERFAGGIVGTHGHSHPVTAGCKFDGIAEQIANDLDDADRVGIHDDLMVRQVGQQLGALVGKQGMEIFDSAGNESSELNALPPQLDVVAADLGRVQKVVDHARQKGRLAFHDFQGLPGLAGSRWHPLQQ